MEGLQGAPWKMNQDDLKKVMELMPASMSGLEPRIWASTCIVAYHGDVSPNYVVSRDQFIGLLRMMDEFECLRCSQVMQMHAIFHEAYGKLKFEYGIGPRYCHALPSCSRFSIPYLRHILLYIASGIIDLCAVYWVYVIKFIFVGK